MIRKRLRTPEGVERFFHGFIAFMDCIEQQIPRSKDKRRKKILFWKEKEIYC
jgi:hypothetical protein